MANRSVITLRRDLGIQLFALYLTFVGAVLLAAFLFARSSSQHLEADISASDLALANAIAQETTTTLTSATSAVKGLAAYPAVIDDQVQGMHNVFEKVLSVRNDVNLIYRLDAAGMMTYHYPEGPESTVGVDFSFRPYFQQARETRSPLISSGRISPTTNQPVTTAVMPLWSGEGEFLGLVGMNIKLQFLSDTLANIATTSYNSEDIQIAIIDSDGQIIAHSNTDFLLEDAHSLMQEVTTEVLSAQTGNLITEDRADKEQLYSYAPIKDSGWGVIVSRPTQSAFVVISAFQRGTGIVVAIFLISGLVFWWNLSRGVIYPLEKLAHLSRTVALEGKQTGNITASLAEFTRRSDQMGILTRSLEDMQKTIEARVYELGTLLKTSAAVVSTLDSQTVLERILEQVEALLGVRMSAIFVLDEQAHLFRVQASRNLPDWYVQKVMIDPVDPNSVAMRAIHTGEPVQISDTEHDPSYVHHRNRAHQAGYRALMAIKLPVQHTPAAVLMVAHQKPYVFSEREIWLLTSFANHATMAIENAALYARSDAHLQEQSRRIEALIQSMQDGLVLEDSEGSIRYTNRRVQELVDLPDETLFQKPIRVLIERLIAQAADPEAMQSTLHQILAQSGIRQLEFDQICRDQTRHIKLTLFDVIDSKGVLIGRGWIIEDITQRYAIERMRSILIATVSHELRTPLAAVQGYASTLLAEDVDWDRTTQREFLTIIAQETDRLSKLVQDLLDMSRIEGGRLTITPILCQVSKLIEQAAAHAAPQLNGRLQIELAPDCPEVSVDKQRIIAVLRNLIENAAKYSPPDSPVQIKAFLEGANLVIHVADQGPGISPDQQALIFERFYRGSHTLAAGTGLGLAIARSFVQVHGGRIWLEPTTIGLRVAFSIPNVIVYD